MIGKCAGLLMPLAAVVSLGCEPQEALPDLNSASAKVVAPTLESAAKNAPAVLYFIKIDCGSNPRAIPLVQKIYAANSKSGKFYAVMNADSKAIAQWAKENGATFPIIPDPDKKIIHTYGIVASQTGILIDKNLKATKRFPGYGRASLESLNASLAGKGVAAKVDLTGAPASGFG